MATTTDLPPAVRVTAPRFYRSFASYFVPYRPVDELAYPDTAGLAGYYRATFDAAGRVVRFDKIRVARLRGGGQVAPVPDGVAPGTRVYFAAVWGPGGPQVPGRRVTYDETDDLDEFFTGTVPAAGDTLPVELLERGRGFVDTYAYWPGGRLRERRTSVPDQARSVGEFYDPDGKKLPEAIPYRWQSLIRPGIEASAVVTYPDARGLFAEALGAAVEEESLHGVAAVLNRLARVDLGEAQDAPPAAKREFAAAAADKVGRAFPLWRAVGNPNGVMSSWFALGHAERFTAQAAAAGGNRAEADRHYDTARQCFRNIIGWGTRGGKWQNVADAYGALRDLAAEFRRPDEEEEAAEGLRHAEAKLAEAKLAGSGAAG